MILIKKADFIICIIIILIIGVGALSIPFFDNTITFHDTHISLPDEVTFINSTQCNIDNVSDSVYFVFSGDEYEGTLFMFDNQTTFKNVLKDVDFINMTLVNSNNSLKIYKSKIYPTCVIFAEIDDYPFMYSIKSTSYTKALNHIYKFKRLNPRIKNFDI